MTVPATVIAEDLLRLDCATQQEANALAEALRAAGGWLEVVAGADCVVLQFDNATLSIDEARQRVAGIDTQSLRRARSQLVEIPVCYAGEFAPDIDRVCEELNIDRDALIDAHTGASHRVRMLGFTPGFAYIDGADEGLSVSRLPDPRVFVEPGSIGLARGQTGIYAMPGPGGWKLIGRTPLRLFDAQADPPFLLQPEDRILFTSISAEEFERMTAA